MYVCMYVVTFSFPFQNNSLFFVCYLSPFAHKTFTFSKHLFTSLRDLSSHFFFFYISLLLIFLFSFFVAYLPSSNLLCIENYHCDVCNWKICSFIYNNFTTVPSFGQSAANKKEKWRAWKGNPYIVLEKFIQYETHSRRGVWIKLSKTFFFKTLMNKKSHKQTSSEVHIGRFSWRR